MTPVDVFGKAFLDFLAGEDPVIEVERDDGYHDLDRAAYYFREYSEFAECEKKALEHARGRVLDIGVGAGRVALHLLSRGHDVTGVDLSEGALETSRRRGVRSLRNMSACELALEKSSFDTAVLFGNNFGLCGTQDGVVDMLTKLRRILTKDGVVLAGSVDPLNTTQPEHLRYHKANTSRGRLPGQVTIRLRYAGTVGEWFDLLFVTPSEMSSLCDRSGWRIDKLYLSPQPSPTYAAVLSKV